MTKRYELASGPVLEQFPLPPDLAGEFSRFLESLSSARRILISSTLTSDGDSIGSQIALRHFIEERRKSNPPERIDIVNESPVPHRYQFLPRTGEIQTYDEWKASGAQPDYDLAISLDGGIERTGKVAALFESVKSTVLIDHHIVGSEMSYSASLLDLESSSTCEIVYCLFEAAGVQLSKEAAEHLYIGIVFDTGFFKHSITRARTHHVAAQLVKTGIDFSDISDRAILERSWGGQLLLRRMLENMERSSCGRVVTSYWSHRDFQEISYKDGDTEGMINQLYHTESCLAVALFVETKPGRIKLSFRSKGDVNVADFARSLNPAGGGHVRAAGCTMEGSLDEIRKLVSGRLLELVSQ